MLDINSNISKQRIAKSNLETPVMALHRKFVCAKCQHQYWSCSVSEQGRCTSRNADCRISKRCILQNFTCGKSLRNKVYFVELKLRKMFSLLSYVNHAHKPRCVLQEEIEANFCHCFGKPTLP